MPLLLSSGIARAENFGGVVSTVTATADFRLVGADAEPAWLDGGFGKARFGGAESDGAFAVHPRAVEGTIAWQPHLSWSLSGTVVATTQRDQTKAVDLSEAFLTLKPLPIGKVKLSTRVGLFWPPISLEHSGPEWRVTDTITPSAINSWISEEVKMAGAEATGTTIFGGHRITISAAVFGYNDTAGTLLAFRGWALHDQNATAFSLQPLPQLNSFMQMVQAPRTRPLAELDSRPGYYIKLGWAPPGPFEIQAFHYDNRGDPETVDSALQWGWRTRFDHLGAVLDVDGHTRVIAQAITGSTRMGFAPGGIRWVNTRFRSAFLLATRSIGSGSISARAEAFGTRSRGSRLGAADSEDGWAVTLAARRPITSYATLLAEALHIDSKRGARLRDGLDPRQQQNVAQFALRLRM